MDGNIKFSDFAEYWLNEYAKKQLRPKTVSGYIGLLERINSGIGHIRLDRLQPNHLMEFYNNLQEQGIRQDIKYAACIDVKPILKAKKVYSQGSFVPVGVISKHCR